MSYQLTLESTRIAQACVIPYRRDGEELTFCLITSLKKRRWIFPKGIIDPGETRDEAGRKEALEEAGLRGRIIGKPIGHYTDSKWGATLDVTVLLMEVDGCDDHWQEANMRERRWARPNEALRLVTRPELRQMLRHAIQRVSPRSTESA
jgi:8-oxo-dGTP pyrophosphatase MutT (NUDIX family)